MQETVLGSISAITLFGTASSLASFIGLLDSQLFGYYYVPRRDDYYVPMHDAIIMSAQATAVSIHRHCHAYYFTIVLSKSSAPLIIRYPLYR